MSEGANVQCGGGREGSFNKQISYHVSCRQKRQLQSGEIGVYMLSEGEIYAQGVDWHKAVKLHPPEVRLFQMTFESRDFSY